MPADISTFNLPQSPDHVGRRIVMATASDRDDYARTFPYELPAGHRLAHRWVGAGAMTLEVFIEPIPAERAPAPETPAEAPPVA